MFTLRYGHFNVFGWFMGETLTFPGHGFFFFLHLLLIVEINFVHEKDYIYKTFTSFVGVFSLAY